MSGASYNDADRLLQVLRKAEGQNKNQTIDHVWATVFGINQSDTKELFKQRTKLIEQSENVEKWMHEILPARSLDIHLQHFKKIQQGLVLPGSMNWSEAAHLFHPEHIRLLDLFADMLAGREPERLVDLEELKAIQQEVEDLHETVLNADIEEELKEVLLEYLDEIRQAIKDYRLKGVRELKRAIQNSLYVIYVGDHYEKQDQGENKTRSNIMLRFTSLIKRIGGAIGPTALKLTEKALEVYIKYQLEAWLGGEPPQIGPGSN